jgi:hypothetical protein
MVCICPPEQARTTEGVPSTVPAWHRGAVKDRDRRLAALASSQHSVFTAAQALSCGLSRSTLDARAKRGLLVREHPSVFAIGGTPRTWQREVMAAVLSVGEPAAASHRTAAELWGMTSRRGGSIEVVTRRWDRVRRPPFAVHESGDLVETDIVLVDGIPVTTAARTVVDLGAIAPKWLVASCLDTALRKRLLTVGQVYRFMGRVAKRGRRGVGVIRPMIEEREGWDGVTESELEDLFRRVVVATGLKMPDAQYELVDGDGGFVCRADFAYPDRRVLIELDSEGFHMDRATFRTDRIKQNRALSLGWQTYRFTWHDLTERRAAVIRILADIRPK